MKTTARLLLFCSLWTISSPLGTLAAAFGPAQGSGENQQSSDIRSRWSDEEKDLRDKVAASSETPIKFQNDPLAPLVIKEASVKYVAIGSPAVAGVSEPVSGFDCYAASLRIGLKNPSSSEVKGILFELKNVATRFRLNRRVTVAPGQEETIRVVLIYVPGEPSSLVVQLAGAWLSPGILWGDFPRDDPAPPSPTGPAALQPHPDAEAAARLSLGTPSLPPKPKLSPQASPETTTPQSPLEQAESVVDTRPILITHGRPNYTEAARRNGVNGATQLRLLVGSDGVVRQVKVARALPDFLTEEAIRCSLELRFKPATKSGQPVAYWTMVEIEFNLR